MDILKIKIIKFIGYNEGVITSMARLQAESLEKEGKIKILGIISSNKIAPEGSEKAEPIKPKAEAKGKKDGGKK